MKLKHAMLLAGALLASQASHGAEVNVTSDITSDTTWTKNNVYILDKSIFVKEGATLTIEPGTWVVGTENTTAMTRGSLVITRDGKIEAVGTKDEPIVFTAKKEYDGEILDPAAGDGGFWGGVIILGNAPINFYTGPTTNQNENEIEGFPAGSTLDIRYGGRDSNASSGRLKYASIRFGGYEFAVGREINGLTLGGVGRGTVIDSVEIVGNTDDGLEIFGGTVNVKRVAVAFCQDDNFDLDEGWRGTAQFLFSIQNANGGLGDRGGEWDGGNGTVRDQAPYNDCRIFNATLIGEGSANATSPNVGIFVDDNFAGQLHNSVVHDFGGVMVMDSGDGIGAAPNPLIANTTFGNFGAGEGTVIDSITGSGVSKGVDPLLRGISRIPDGGLDPRPASNSPLLTASLSELPAGFEAAPYRGAFGEKNWLDGWSFLSQKGYLPAPVDPNAPVFSSEPQSTVATATSTVRLSAAASGDGEVTYQWFRNDQPIPEATGASYVISRLTATTAGMYHVEATLDGKFTSRSATANVEVAKLTLANLRATANQAFRVRVDRNFRANRFQAVGLPSGLSIDSKGVISGKTSRKGRFLVKVVATQVVDGKVRVRAEVTRRLVVR